jgi:hypothetical protein
VLSSPPVRHRLHRFRFVSGHVLRASTGLSSTVRAMGNGRGARTSSSLLHCGTDGVGEGDYFGRRSSASAAPRTLGCRLHGWHKYEYSFQIATPQIRVFSVLGFAAALSHCAIPFHSFALLMAVFG